MRNSESEWTCDKGSVSFQEHISGGQKFEREIGYGLVFELDPYDANGWAINIISKDAGTEYDFPPTYLFAPPLHGPGNPAFIEVQQHNPFPVPSTRNFCFVADKADSDKLNDAIYRLESGQAGDFSPDVAWGAGELIIRNIESGAAFGTRAAVIKSMDFTVTLRFPADCTLF